MAPTLWGRTDKAPRSADRSARCRGRARVGVEILDGRAPLGRRAGHTRRTAGRAGSPGAMLSQISTPGAPLLSAPRGESPRRRSCTTRTKGRARHHGGSDGPDLKPRCHTHPPTRAVYGRSRRGMARLRPNQGARRPGPVQRENNGCARPGAVPDHEVVAIHLAGLLAVDPLLRTGDAAVSIRGCLVRVGAEHSRLCRGSGPGRRGSARMRSCGA